MTARGTREGCCYGFTAKGSPALNEKLDHYCRIWGLRSLGKLAEDRPTSRIYKVEYEGRAAVLKVLTPVGVEDERHGAAALEYWDGHGAAHLYRADAGAHLLEFIGGGDCVALVHAGRDNEASAIIGDALARLHAARPGPPPEAFTALEERFQELFDVAARRGTDPIFQSAATQARALLNERLNNTVLHGDLHHENILHSSERGWLAIDAKGLRGETTYDAAMAVLNPKGVDALIETPQRISSIVKILAAKLDVPDRRLLQYTFAHACLCASWSMESSIFSSAQALRMARLIEAMLSP